MLFDMSLKLTLLYKRFYLFRKFIVFFHNFLHCKTEYNFFISKYRDKGFNVIINRENKTKIKKGLNLRRN